MRIAAALILMLSQQECFCEAEAAGGLPREVPVRVPKIVREDLVGQAIGFCQKVYGEAWGESLQEEWKVHVEKGVWPVVHNARSTTGLYGSVAELGGDLARANVSFPSGHPLKTVLWERPGRPEPGKEYKRISLAEAAGKAARIMNLVAPARRRDAYRLEQKKEVPGYYRFHWTSPMPGGGEPGFIRVEIHPLTGVAFRCKLADREPAASGELSRTRKEIEEKVEKVFGAVKPECLKLTASYVLGRHRCCWQYELPPKPMGGPLTTNWDAVTGELVSSNVIDGEGNRIHEDQFYGNPKYYPQTKEEVIKRLEEAALARARELEAAARAAGGSTHPVASP